MRRFVIFDRSTYTIKQQSKSVNSYDFQSMHISSFAKINLGLRVIGKRSDGYHEIETIFQLIDVTDDLDIHVGVQGISVNCSPLLGPEHENLAYRAASLLQRTFHVQDGCEIAIKKHIPVGGGLGGGSSNAATTLMALNALWNLRLSQSKMLELAATLGSDVAFFILGGTALGQGRGEILTPIGAGMEYWGVLVCPGITIFSKTVYENLNFSLTKSFKNSRFAGFIKKFHKVTLWQDVLLNDLESVVFSTYPELRQIRNKLQSGGAFFSSMSGSGSSIFGLYLSKAAAENIQCDLAKRHNTILFKPVYKASSELWH